MASLEGEYQPNHGVSFHQKLVESGVAVVSDSGFFYKSSVVLLKPLPFCSFQMWATEVWLVHVSSILYHVESLVTDWLSKHLACFRGWNSISAP